MTPVLLWTTAALALLPGEDADNIPLAIPEALKIFPSGGPMEGSTTVEITGRNMDHVKQAKFGETVIPAKVMPKSEGKEAFVVVNVPPRKANSTEGANGAQTGDVPIFLSNNEMNHPSPDFVKSKVLFNYYTFTMKEISPHHGPPGKVVSIRGDGFDTYGRAMNEGKCKFGPLKATRVLKVKSEFVECQVPFAPEGSVLEVSLSLNGQDFEGAAGTDIEFTVKDPEHVDPFADAPDAVTRNFPVVLLPDVLMGREELSAFQKVLEETVPGVRVTIPKMSRFDQGAEGDLPYSNTVTWAMNEQVEWLCNFLMLSKDNLQLGNGFNLVGLGQGGLVGRGYVERCPQGPKVNNLVSLVAPQAGIMGPPAEDGKINQWVPDYSEPYESQGMYSFADYWRDPLHLEEHLERSVYLADLNNERPRKKAEYSDRIKKLNKLAIIGSSKDEVIKPWQSTFFGYYAPGTTVEFVLLRDSIAYRDDWLGLRSMDERGDLVVHDCKCSHLTFVQAQTECRVIVKKYLFPLLNGTRPATGTAQERRAASDRRLAAYMATKQAQEHRYSQAMLRENLEQRRISFDEALLVAQKV